MPDSGKLDDPNEKSSPKRYQELRKHYQDTPLGAGHTCLENISSSRCCTGRCNTAGAGTATGNLDIAVLTWIMRNGDRPLAGPPKTQNGVLIVLRMLQITRESTVKVILATFDGSAQIVQMMLTYLVGWSDVP